MKTNLLPLFVLAGSAALFCLTTAFALDALWQVEDGDFNVASNWSTGEVPAAPGSTAVINGGTARFTEGDRTVEAIFVGRNGVGALRVSGGRFSVVRYASIGAFGGGVIGDPGSIWGTLEIAGDGVFEALGFEVVVGSRYSLGELILRENGEFTQWNETFMLGTNGRGRLEIHDGARFNHFVRGGQIYIGIHSNGIGEVTQYGGEFNATLPVNVGSEGGTGAFELFGGIFRAPDRLSLGRTSGTGAMTVTGGRLEKTGSGHLIVGDNSRGTFVQTGGEVWVGGGEVRIGDGDDASGELAIHGGDFAIEDSIVVGREGGEGEMTITGGSISVTGGGHFEVASAGTNSRGVVHQSSGYVDTNGGRLNIGSANGASGVVTVSGDAVIDAGIVNVTGAGADAEGVLRLEGGMLIANRITGNLSDLVDPGASTVILDGGTIRAKQHHSRFFDGFGVVDIQPGGMTVDSNGFAITIGQALPGAGGLIKTGDGTLVLSGANTYSGETNVNAGRLIVTTATGDGGAYSVAGEAVLGVRLEEPGARVAASSLFLEEEAGIEFDLGSFGAIEAAAVSVGELTVEEMAFVHIKADALPLGSHLLMEYESRTGEGVFDLGMLPPGVAATLVDDRENRSLTLVVTEVVSLVWDAGEDDGHWDIGATPNWKDQLSGAAAVFRNGDPVAFTNALVGAFDVEIGDMVSPGSLVFHNDAETIYTLVGEGGISGGTGITKSGSGTAVIRTLNEYTGVTRIQGGRLSVTTIEDGGQSSSIGASSAAPENLVLAGGTLHYLGEGAASDRGFLLDGGLNAVAIDGDLTFGGPVTMTSNEGRLLKTGPGTLTLTNPGENLLGSGGALPAIQVASGGLTLDGGGTQVNLVSGELRVGGMEIGDARVSLHDTVLRVGSRLAVGREHGTSGLLAAFTSVNSTINAATLSMGLSGGMVNYRANQEMTLTDSRFAVADRVQIGESDGSSASLVLRGETVFTSGKRVTLGVNPGATGSLSVWDAGLVHTNRDFSVGQWGKGVLSLGGTAKLKADGAFYVGELEPSEGELTLQDDASVVVAGGSVYLGMVPGSKATVKQSGGAFIYEGSDHFRIGSGGTANWTQTGGRVEARGWVVLGRHDTGVGHLDVSGGEFMAVQEHRRIIVGEEGSGTLTISGGGIVSSVQEGVRIAQAAGSRGIVNLNGGELITRALVGGAGESTLNLNGGLIRVSPNAAAAFVSEPNLRLQVLDGGARIDTGGTNISFRAGLMAGPGSLGGLTKLGEGSLRLSQVSTYLGPTEVVEGSLIIDTNNSAVTGPVTVHAGAGIGGTGSLGGGVTLLGTLEANMDRDRSSRLEIGGELDISEGALRVQSFQVPTEKLYILASYGSRVGFFSDVTLPEGYAVHYDFQGNKIALVTEDAPLLSYADWAASFDLEPGGDGGPLEDLSGDGLSNLAKYALGRSPNTVGPLPVAVMADGYFELPYARSIWAYEAKVTAEYSSDLNNDWTTNNISDTFVKREGDLEHRIARIPADGPRGYIRLRVTIPQ